LAQLLLARDGTYYVVAAGRAHHAGPGKWQQVTNGNAHLIGIEAENTGLIEGPKADPWPMVQMNASRWGVAAILRQIGAGASMCCGHGEYALPKGRKNDPSFEMDQFRLDVDACITILGVGKVSDPLQDSPGTTLPRRQYVHGRYIV
jgi:N-acetyl-anhydromuramyl-L-alanine amidase AmpD